MQQKNTEKLINDAMHKLDKDNYKIIYELFFNNTSIHQLSKKLGISRSGVRYRKDKALEQLKNIILRQVKVENFEQESFYTK